MAALIETHSSRLHHPYLRTVLSVAYLGAAAMISMMSLTACGSDTAGPRTIPPVSVLQLDVSAVNLALTPPYDTAQLHATAMTSTGAPADGAEIRYTNTDSTVTVDSLTGVLTAHYVTARTQVLATLHRDNTTVADTVVIQVTATVQPRPRTFTLLPNVDGTPVDSAKVAVDYYDPPVLYIQAVDSAGDSVCTVNGCGLLWAATSSNPNIAMLDIYGDVLPENIGHVTFTATALVYGVRYQSALPFIVNYPLNQTVSVRARTVAGDSTQLYFYPAVDTAAVGGRLNFLNPNTDSIDVVFDDSAAAGSFCGYSGNIAPFMTTPTNQGDCHFFRRFNQAGTYHYHSRLFGTSGTLVVQ